MDYFMLKKLYDEVFLYIVGGVNSLFRLNKGVGGGIFVIMEWVSGVYFYDVDGNKYIDYLVVFGLIIIGYVYFYIIEVIIKVV